MNVSTVATEQSELREMVLCETDKRGIPVNREALTPERRRPENILLTIASVCVEKADSVNQPETCSCWTCCCLIIWGYRVSCLAAIVTEGRFYGIYLFTEDRRVFNRGWGIVGNPVMPSDVICVYTKMNENFKGLFVCLLEFNVSLSQ